MPADRTSCSSFGRKAQSSLQSDSTPCILATLLTSSRRNEDAVSVLMPLWQWCKINILSFLATGKFVCQAAILYTMKYASSLPQLRDLKLKASPLRVSVHHEASALVLQYPVPVLRTYEQQEQTTRRPAPSSRGSSPERMNWSFEPCCGNSSARPTTPVTPLPNFQWCLGACPNVGASVAMLESTLQHRPPLVERWLQASETSRPMLQASQPMLAHVS